MPHFYFIIVEFGVHLAELTVDPQGALAIRQVSITCAIVVVVFTACLKCAVLKICVCSVSRPFLRPH